MDAHVHVDDAGPLQPCAELVFTAVKENRTLLCSSWLGCWDEVAHRWPLDQVRAAVSGGECEFPREGHLPPPWSSGDGLGIVPIVHPRDHDSPLVGCVIERDGGVVVPAPIQPVISLQLLPRVG